MREELKAQLAREGGKLMSDLLRITFSRPRNKSAEEQTEASTPTTTEEKPEVPPQAASLTLPTREETTAELKRRLAKELYKAELDLSAGLKIAGKP
jgi:hypothetical protein